LPSARRRRRAVPGAARSSLTSNGTMSPRGITTTCVRRGSVPSARRAPAAAPARSSSRRPRALPAECARAAGVVGGELPALVAAVVAQEVVAARVHAQPQVPALEDRFSRAWASTAASRRASWSISLVAAEHACRDHRHARDDADDHDHHQQFEQREARGEPPPGPALVTRCSSWPTSASGPSPPGLPSAPRCTGRTRRGYPGHVQVVVAPRVLLEPVDVATLLPVADVGIGRLGDQRLQALLGRGIAEIVHAVQVERRLIGADVLLALVTRASSMRRITFGATRAARMPRMTTTTMISIRVNPFWDRGVAPSRRERPPMESVRRAGSSSA